MTKPKARPMIDREQLHELFLAGKPIKDIAQELGCSYGTIRTVIYQERLLNPLEWPHRVKSNIAKMVQQIPLMMHLYECLECITTFSVEDYEGTDHSATVCPICGHDELEDKGYGRFIVTQKPLAEAK